MGYRSCFYRTVPLGAPPRPDLALAVDPAMPRPGAAHGH
jgi:hypothetical protein